MYILIDWMTLDLIRQKSGKPKLFDSKQAAIEHGLKTTTKGYLQLISMPLLAEQFIKTKIGGKGKQ